MRNDLTVAIGADHAGYALKEEIKAYLKELGYGCEDFGTYSTEAVDYPDIAKQVAEAVAGGTYERGIVLCGTGVGSSMAANKVPGVRAALCNDLFTARYSRLHNDANVLAMGARVVGAEVAKEILKTWLSTEFEGGRHLRRVEKIRLIEEESRAKVGKGGSKEGECEEVH